MAQIESQIDVLNEDFRRLNPDATNTPVEFQSVAADVGIEFFLACIDPDGDPTNGVVRTLTTNTVFNEHLDDIKYTSLGGSNAWPTDRYLNIWVGETIEDQYGNELLGYAQFPDQFTTKPNTDGVVIRTVSFGRTGNVTSPFDEGRTTTHEVGHWLNLRHIWGDGSGCNSPTAPLNCACHLDDGVADTPNQGRANYSCPSHPHATCSSNDMFMNYMDYTDDACMNIFTQGQRTRMRALFAEGGVRRGIIENPTGISITGPDFLCNSETYTITNLPTGSTVTGWSASPSSAVTFSGSGNSRTVTRNPAYNGPVYLTATIATTCGSLTIERELYAGLATGHFIDGPTSLSPGSMGLYYAENTIPPSPMGVTTWNWFLSPPPASYTITPVADGVARVRIWTPGTYLLALSVVNPCGTAAAVTLPITVSSGGGAGGRFTVFPNPADETLTVSFQDDSIDTKSNDTFTSTAFTTILYDGSGREQRRGESKGGKIQFETAGLPEGTYFVHIHKGGEVEKRQVVIRH